MSRRLLLAAALGLAACGAAQSQDGTAHAILPGPGGLPAYFDCVREAGALVVSAHRGGPVAGYPENALETFAHTLSRMPAILEIDVQPSADGVLVLMHDDALDRTTTGEGPVEDMTLEQLRALRLVDNDGAETGYRIPTLAEALDWAQGRTVLVLDRKQSVPFADLIAQVEAAGAMNRVLWATYSAEETLELAALAPGAMIVAPMDSLADLDALIAGGADADRLIVWSGTETPQPELYADLAARGVESAFATLGNWTGSWDNRIKVLGDDALYGRLADGVQILATDRMFAVHEALPQTAGAAACPVGD